MNSEQYVYRPQFFVHGTLVLVGLLTVWQVLGNDTVWQKFPDPELARVCRVLAGSLGSLMLLPGLILLPSRIILDAEGLTFIGAWGKVQRQLPWDTVDSWTVRDGLLATGAGEAGALSFCCSSRNIMFRRSGLPPFLVLENETSGFFWRLGCFDRVVAAVRTFIPQKEVPADLGSLQGRA